MSSRYPIATKVEARRQFIEEDRSPYEISSSFGGYPTPQCIHNWATKPDKDGNTWYDLREERHDQLLTQAQPRSLMVKVLEKINKIIEDEHFDTKKADSLAKLTSVFRTIVDDRYHAQVFYQFANDLVLFIDANYPELKTEELIACIRDFKNEVKRRVNLGGSPNP